MTQVWERFLPDEDSTLSAGSEMAAQLSNDLVFLEGDLGSGKTTFVRGLMRGLGFDGAVKSPTYTLLEPYEVGARRIYHFDFYRINDPQELSYIGIDELLADSALKLIEWPELGGALLPSADVVLKFTLSGSGRRLVIEDHRG